MKEAEKREKGKKSKLSRKHIKMMSTYAPNETSVQTDQEKNREDTNDQ